MSSAPWRGEESEESFKEGKLKVTRQGDGTSTMHVPASNSKHLHHHHHHGINIDPQLRYSFQRNFQVSNHYLIPNNFFNLSAMFDLGNQFVRLILILILYDSLVTQYHALEPLIHHYIINCSVSPVLLLLLHFMCTLHANAIHFSFVIIFIVLQT